MVILAKSTSSGDQYLAFKREPNNFYKTIYSIKQFKKKIKGILSLQG